MANTTTNAKFISGPDAITVPNIPGVSAIAAANAFTQTYSTALKTVGDAATSPGNLDGTDTVNAAQLALFINDLKGNVNALIDVLQAHGLAS